MLWEFEEIVSHQGPLAMDHNDYNGSTYNVLIQWSTGEITTEPLTVIAKDNPVICTLYVKHNGLLDRPGWKRFKKCQLTKEIDWTHQPGQVEILPLNSQIYVWLSNPSRLCRSYQTG